MKVLCALNPTASGGLALERWPEVASILEGLGASFDLVADPESRIEEQLVERLRNSEPGYYDAILGAGGDGTHSALINALHRYTETEHRPVPPYALLPLGTGNDIAKSFGLNSRENFFVSDLRRAVSTALYGAFYDLDLGRLGDRYFVDAFTIGLDSSILKEHNIQKLKIRQLGVPIIRKILHGPLLYGLVTSKIFWRKTIPRDVTIRVDDTEWYKGPMVNLVINNTRIYAGAFDFCTDAYSNDGKLDIVLFHERYDYLGKYVLSLRKNPLNIRKMAATLNQVASHTQGRHIEISVQKDTAAQIDGEELPPAREFIIDVKPKAFRIKTPAEP